jgi:ABC-type lipoprotein release transport system permease subunit
MTFARAWLRLEVRRRWRSLAVLALLAALAGGTVMASVAGARREASVIERLSAKVKPSQIAIYSNTSGIDWTRVRSFPQVEALSTFLLDYTYRYAGLPDDVAGFPPTDSETLRSIETPVVFKGRMWDPARADEVVVTRTFVAKQHKDVGDTVVLSLPTPEELADGGGSGPNGAFTGPQLPMRIVGVVSSAFFADEPGGQGFVEMSPGVAAKYRANLIGPEGGNNLFNYESAVVRLRNGEADIPSFQAALRAAFPDESFEINNNLDQYREAQRHISFDARCLLAFGAAALIAALFLVGQALARYVSSNAGELRTLWATGLTPRQVTQAAAAAVTTVGIAGALMAIGVAYAASVFFPLSLTRILEPSPGFSSDWVVFGTGSAAILLLVGGGGALAATSAARASRHVAAPRRSSVATAARRSGVPVPLSVGTRFALERGRGASSVPVRPALFGAVAGVLGVLAAFTFARGVAESVANPLRFGQTVALEGFLGVEGEDFVPSDRIEAAVRTNPSVVGVNSSRQGIATRPGSRSTIVLYTRETSVAQLPVVLLDGRLPERAGEVALAPTTLSRLDLKVGDRVMLTGDREGAGVRSATLTVTGKALMPSGPRNGYADGGWVLPETYDSLFTGFRFHLLQLALAGGADREDVARELAATIAQRVPDAAGYELRPPDKPGEVFEIEQVRGLPIVLGAFLALLAVAAVGHGLVTAVRRRRGELAVLRALGMTPAQSRVVVVTQATVLAVVGLLFGVPLGIALGRTVWRAVADSTPVQYAAPFASLTLILVVPGAFVAANLLAAWPARRAARLRVAEVLRAE